MAEYYTSDYNSPDDVVSEIESAIDSLRNAQNMMNDFDDATDAIAESANELSREFQGNLKDMLKTIAEAQAVLLEAIDDDTDVMLVDSIFSDIVRLLNTSDQRPWVSKYSLIRNLKDAVRGVVNTRQVAIDEANKPAETETADNAAAY